MMIPAGHDAVAVKRLQLSWLLFVRITIIFIFLGGTLLYYNRNQGSWLGVGPVAMYTLAALSFIHAFFSALFLRRTRRFRLFIHLQVVWDLLFTICLIHFSGGIQSFFSFLFILLIVGYGFFLQRRELLLCASGAAILYGSLLDLQYYGYIQSPANLGVDTVQLAEVVYAVFVNVSAYYITAFLSGTLIARLRTSEKALEKKSIDYKELESLNRAIMANIGSGLMLINHEGRIRLLNTAAERITCYSLQEVYGVKLSELFPEMDVVGENGFKIVGREECRIRSKEGQMRHLGYHSTLIKPPGDKRLNLLVSFQNLTELKIVEERLLQADRMAVVGQMAAGLAHEIRNPLASINGTLQLLMESLEVDDINSRLIQITTREVRRLNKLLTEFLDYARPSVASAELVDCREIVDSLMELIRSDQRFAQVEIEVDCVSSALFQVDGEKVRQALWNLVLNGAEAMNFRGKINLRCDQENYRIIVEDNGCGIEAENMQRVFEPFYTTKDAGTGLGLATVFSIMHAHGGHVTISNRIDCQGARVELSFPAPALGENLS